MKLDLLPHTILKKNEFKINKRLQCRAKIIKRLKENIGINDLGLDNEFLDVTPKITSNKRKNTQNEHY